MKPNDVIREYNKEKIVLTVKELAGDPETILFEGDAKALEFLGKLIIAQAQNRDNQGCTLQLSPNSAGSAYFSAESTKGILIHVLPCEYEGQKKGHL
jgi:hypothetical protein